MQSGIKMAVNVAQEQEIGVNIRLSGDYNAEN